MAVTVVAGPCGSAANGRIRPAQCAALRKEAIAPEHLDRILEAARRTPSAGNQRAWDFVVCTDPEQLAQLARVWRSRS